MKLLNGLLLALLLTATLTSCGKDDEIKGIVGTWEGKWGFGELTPDVYEKWELKKNGELVAYDDDGDLYASGTWSVDGVHFEAEYTPTGYNYSYSFSGLYGEAIDEIIGNWGSTPSSTDGGTFEMYKK